MMMIRMHNLCLAACFMLLAAGPIFAQTTYKLELVGTVQLPNHPFFCGGTDTTGGSDVWEYTAPVGSEYAIMGVRDGVAFVKVPEMQVIGIVPGPTKENCFWHRDIKTHGHYAYVTSELTGTNEGVIIIDLQFLPDSVRFVRSYRTSFDILSHNLSIDVQTGYAYIVKQNYSGFRVVSLADPENPVDVNTVFTPGIHDVYARNDTVYVAEGNSRTFAIYNLRDKRNPVLLSRVRIPIAGYVHNIWPTEDGKYAMTTEETQAKTIKMWDIRNINNIELVGEYLGANQLAHNAHIRGDLAVISHYAYGVALVDIGDPAHPVELDRFDTYPRNDAPGFRGCWGAYPFTQNNYVYTFMRVIWTAS
jgi:choice-of-anchor B domain-containing protein